MKKQSLFTLSGIILAIIFILPLIVFGVFNTGNAVGLFLSAILCCYGHFFKKIHTFIKKLWKKRLGKTFLCLILALCIFGASLSFAIGAKMISATNNLPTGKTTAVVLGCMVYPHGPSLSLKQRLDAAYEFLTRNPNARCVLSGGKGENEPVSEALAMEEYLIKLGISPDRLFREEKSTNTRENILFSKEIIEKEGLCPDITLITNNFHQYRAQKIAEECDIKSYGFSAKSHFILFPCYAVREICAIMAMMLGGK